MARTHEQFLQEIEDRNIANPLFKIAIKEGQVYQKLDQKMTFECGNGHPDFETLPRYIIHRKTGCPECGSAKISHSNSRGIEEIQKDLVGISSGIKLANINQLYVNNNTKLEFVCSKKHRFSARVKSILRGSGCPICANKSRRIILSNPVDAGIDRSVKYQTEINRLIKGMDIGVVVVSTTSPNERSTISNQLKLATKHTLFIFDDEWENNKELIVNKIMHYSNNSKLESIPARKCAIKQISSSEKRELLNNNHIQGSDNATISYGAYYKDRLVAVMTFSAPRVAVGAKGERGKQIGVWELSRFCTDVAVRIPGIASKLLAHFKRNHEWTEIYSFADKRWSTGNMYTKMGFELVANNKPSYFYVIDGVRKHRWGYRKDMLKKILPNYDANLSEYQNMENHGYYRVWDCGTLKFSMVNTGSS